MILRHRPLYLLEVSYNDVVHIGMRMANDWHGSGIIDGHIDDDASQGVTHLPL